MSRIRAVNRAGWQYLLLILLLAGSVNCGGSSVTGPSPTSIDGTPRPGPNGTVVSSKVIAAKDCTSSPGPAATPPPSLAQYDTFVRSLEVAIKLSGLRAVEPPKIPAGTIIQGYDVPYSTGVHVVVVDITRNCDLQAARVIQIHESDVNPSLPPSINSSATRLKIGGKVVGHLSGSQGGAYFWDGKELSYWLTVYNNDVVSEQQVEQVIAAMP